MLGVIDELEDSRTKHQAYQFLRRSLKEAISRIQDSTSSVETKIADLQNNVSEQQGTVDNLKAKVSQSGQKPETPQRISTG
jgi:peptidoglycan hydrolase CwlO-like protein